MRQTESYKIVHNLTDIPLTHHLQGHPINFQQANYQSWLVPVFIFSSAIKIWNALPNDVILSTNLNQFKTKLAGLA